MRTRSTALALIWLAATNLATATDLTSGDRNSIQPDGNTILALGVFDGGSTFEPGAFQLGEESAETIIAAKNDDRERVVSEASDLLYHLVVLLVARGVSLEEIAKELGERRKGQSERA